MEHSQESMRELKDFAEAWQKKHDTGLSILIGNNITRGEVPEMPTLLMGVNTESLAIYLRAVTKALVLELGDGDPKITKAVDEAITKAGDALVLVGLAKKAGVSGEAQAPKAPPTLRIVENDLEEEG